MIVFVLLYRSVLYISHLYIYNKSISQFGAEERVRTSDYRLETCRVTFTLLPHVS
jgi:hypothetical protein